ncbi:MAG: DNA polymerase subunit beta [Methanosphaera sp.]|nr:DNA polymerase subunit beta [Methanosphaera sp.]
MKVHTRYYIKTIDNLFFAVNSYIHPETHYVAFLRYVPSDDGDRILDGIKYKKLNSTQAYEYLKKNHPDYLFEWNITNKKMMGVPVEDVAMVYNPALGLKKIRENRNKSALYEKICLLSDIFHDYAGIEYANMGVTGSSLIGLESDTSDIDFIVFGLDEHKRAIEFYSRAKNDDDIILEAINDKYWEFVYDKRIKDDSMSLDEFKYYESRKNNRGIIRNTLFDILLNRNDDEIDATDNITINQLEKIRIKCDICDDSLSYDNPATYGIANVEFLEGVPKNIESIISFTHTYTGIVKNNERVIASGVCEEYVNKDSGKKTYKLIIGTTRESIGEYLKLEKSPVK